MHFLRFFLMLFSGLIARRRRASARLSIRVSQGEINASYPQPDCAICVLVPLRTTALLPCPPIPDPPGDIFRRSAGIQAP
jgi:hypothetical protein